MRKKERQKWIKQMIGQERVSKQEELVCLLQRHGVPVTQATVSRDIKDLNLVKHVDDDGSYRYGLPKTDTIEKRRLEKMIKTSFVKVEVMNNMLSLVTTPGSGVAIGKLIEHVYHEELFSIMTNDDKILVITRNNDQVKMIEKELVAMR